LASVVREVRDGLRDFPDAVTDLAGVLGEVREQLRDFADGEREVRE